MFKSYFKIGWRNLLRNKGYSLINIGGLALGMAVATLIGLWVHDEISFDKNYANYEHIAQIRKRGTDPNTGITNGGDAIQIPVGTLLKSNYPHYFRHVLLAFWIGERVLSTNDKKVLQTGEFIEPGVIDMLSLKMIKGTNGALHDPHSIILSRHAADTFFGSEEPIGKAMKIDNRMDVIVTGVYDDLQENSRFGDVHFFATWDLWVSSNEWIRNSENDWGNSSFNVYVQLQPGISMQTAAAGIKDFWFNEGPKDLQDDIKKIKAELLLYPMRQWHLYSEFKNGLPEGGRITFVWLFGIVGVFVLLLGCINFMNLSTARSEKRAREVGVRKAIGSVRSQLVQQFMSESFLVVLLAFAVSLLLVSFSLSMFNDLAEKKLNLPFAQPFFWLISTGFIIVTGLLSSLYPAFYLSSFQPVKVLKGALRLGRFASMPRKILVVIQFTVSVVLIIGTMVVYRQIQYARDRPIGYEREGIISMPANDPNYHGKYDIIKNELLKTGVVSEMAASSSPITAVWNNVGGFTWSGKNPELASDFSMTDISYDFGKLVNWQITAGRDFSRSFKTDSSAIIINESAAKYMGMKNPIGEVIRANDGKNEYHIIGVIRDLIMTSPYAPEKRAFFMLDSNYGNVGQIHVKINPTISAREALPRIEAVFKAIVPSASFDYRFVDQQYAKKFGQEERIGKLALLFAILAIFISCLGLFGLASFVAEQRIKEIGIRKVMGASVFSLWKMLGKDFALLVVISVFFSIPGAYYVMNNWLQRYEYRTEMSWWIFAVAGLGALMITLFTVSYQSLKASLANPVNSLRTE